MSTSDFLTFWGKAKPRDESARWHPVAHHLLDVAAVVDRLLTARPRALRTGAELLAIDEQSTRTLLLSLASLHDIGKFAPGFQALAPAYWPGVLGTLHLDRVRRSRHTEDGYCLWRHQLAAVVTRRVAPGSEDALRVLAPAVFGHHGRPVGGFDVPLVEEVFGRAASKAAIQCVEALLSLLCPTPLTVPPIDESRAITASWWVAGLITVADWAGSNQSWFRYKAPDGDESLQRYWSQTRAAAERAVKDAGLAAPRVARARDFVQLTGLTREPSPAQRWALDAVLPSGPLLVIIEDVTGAGKTEAAHVLVHRLMREGRASGAFWAMPTQATANAMYGRQAKLIDSLFDASTGSAPSLVLAHGQQRLHDGFRATVLDGIAEPPMPDPADHENADQLHGTAACAAFLADDRRAALLADVGSGTVDQAILSVLPTRFNVVRLFGLADKVLVIDEAHAYDAYMEVELQALVQFQAALGGSAIILSATLSQRQRESFERAWRESSSREPVRRRSRREKPGVAAASEVPYPLATTVTADRVDHIQVRAAPWSHRKVGVQLVHAPEDAIEHVSKCAGAGGAVVWIRNTVDDCLDAAARLRERRLDPLVFHARFAQCDRQSRESEVLALFGPCSTPEARRGRVLVATQVVEQSLDLDFDAMVSDLAPIDLLVQRAGRLQRHPNRDGDRPRDIDKKLVVLSPPDEEAPAEGWLGGVFSGTAHVYENAGVLWRTVRTLGRVKSITTPDGLRVLIEAVYGADEVPNSLQQKSLRAAGKASGHAAAATFGTLKVNEGYRGGAAAWMNDLRVPTRLGREQVTVRLARVAESGELLPWATDVKPAWKAWALSEIRLSAARVPFSVQVEGAHSAAAGRVRAEWGRFEQELPMLPLVPDGSGVWRGVLVDAAKRGRIALRYTAAEGLSYELRFG